MKRDSCRPSLNRRQSLRHGEEGVPAHAPYLSLSPRLEIRSPGIMSAALRMRRSRGRGQDGERRISNGRHQGRERIGATAR